MHNVLPVSPLCMSVRPCVCPEGRAGFAAAEDDEWSPAVKLDGVGMMDLPNGQSSITTAAATVSEVRTVFRLHLECAPLGTAAHRFLAFIGAHENPYNTWTVCPEGE